MNLKLSVLVLAGAMTLTASAQEQAGRATKVSYDKGASHNWFTTFLGGASISGNGHNSEAVFKDRLSFSPSLAVGKWHNPYFATRLKVEAGEVKSFMKATSLSKHEHHYVGAHYDFMFDVVNFFSQKPGACPVGLTPFVGVGYEYKFDSNKDFKATHAATANLGLQLAVRLAKRVDFILEGQTTWNGLQIKNSFPTDYANNLRYSASAGLNFRLGKVGFSPVKRLDESLVNGLRKQIAALEAENAELAKRPKDCPEVAPTVTTTTANRFLADKSILFAHGKSAVSKCQYITLFDASEFVNKHGGEVVVTGYIQKSESRFKELAAQRAQEVANILIKEYGVPSDKISIEYKEIADAPFGEEHGAWNRTVVIRSK